MHVHKTTGMPVFLVQHDNDATFSTRPLGEGGQVDKLSSYEFNSQFREATAEELDAHVADRADAAKAERQAEIADAVRSALGKGGGDDNAQLVKAAQAAAKAAETAAAAATKAADAATKVADATTAAAAKAAKP